RAVRRTYGWSTTRRRSVMSATSAMRPIFPQPDGDEVCRGAIRRLACLPHACRQPQTPVRGAGDGETGQARESCLDAIDARQVSGLVLREAAHPTVDARRGGRLRRTERLRHFAVQAVDELVVVELRRAG